MTHSSLRVGKVGRKGLRHKERVGGAQPVRIRDKEQAERSPAYPWICRRGSTPSNRGNRCYILLYTKYRQTGLNCGLLILEQSGISLLLELLDFATLTSGLHSKITYQADRSSGRARHRCRCRFARCRYPSRTGWRRRRRPRRIARSARRSTRPRKRSGTLSTRSWLSWSCRTRRSGKARWSTGPFHTSCR